MVWTHPTDGTAYLLVFHESLWMGDKLDHTSVNPNQLQAYGVSFQDNPFESKPLSITTDDVSVNLYSEGMIICGDTRTPTETDLGQLPRLILTSPHDWVPIMSVSRPTAVIHQTAHQPRLVIQYLQWTHYCNTQFMTQLWWSH